jgi:ribose transport system substrate-binding protein
MKIFKKIFLILLLCIVLTTFAYGAEQLTFGMIMREASAPFSRAMILGAENKANELGVKLIVKDAQNDSIRQLNLMDTFITMGIDGFIFGGAVDQKAIIPGIKNMNENNIPIMAIDTCPVGGRIELFIAVDYKETAHQAAEALIKDLKKKHGGEVPKGVIIEITGALVDHATHDFTEGLNSVITNYPQLEVVQGEGKWNNEDSFNRTTDLLMRFGDEVVAFYIHTPDIMSPGVISAIEKQDYDPSKFSITGVWAGPEGLQFIREGKISAIVAPPAMEVAELSVQYLYDLNSGKKIPQIGDNVVEEGAVWSPAKVVTNPYCEGGFMKIKGALIPWEVSPDDPRLWENLLTK